MNTPVDYVPFQARIESIVEETVDVKTFRLVFCDPAVAESFSFRPGQFGLYSVFGAGEATFCIASSPTRKRYIECSVNKAGRVTTELHQCNTGDVIGFRGPYGNWFPLDEMAGKNLLFVGGGIGLAPLRSVIWNVVDWRDRFARVTILYGARSVGDLVYKSELTAWQEMDSLNTVYTVDPGGETPGWAGKVGFVPAVLEEMKPSPANTVVITCGPPIMIKFVLASLGKLGFSLDAAYTTLENRMKCGIGKCGRCNVGPLYVCKDGPVFRCDQLRALPQEY
ncbi:MAG: FAD/NAD(P)-binding protein [Candidatus Hydrogenedentes bacterium]|nr:FAD/NAD(P)-binding protein [Candidatus Hydrogenedentota bacterium]